MKKLIIALLLCAAGSVHAATIDLAGKWQVMLDPTDEGANNYLHQQPFPATAPVIQLPGALADAGLGTPVTVRDRDMLTYSPKFVGSAWYRREFEVPATMEDMRFELLLERVMWLSRVWVDGRYVGAQDSLATPHVFDIGELAPGKHTLTVMVNNEEQHRQGTQGHSYCKNMQKLWNGIVGRIELRARSPLHVGAVLVFPAADAKSLKAEVCLRNGDGQKQPVKLRLDVLDYVTGKVVQSQTFDHKPTGKDETVDFEMRWDAAAKLWDDVEPNLYRLRVALPNDEESVRLGFRSVSREGNRLLLNGRPWFMRGNADAFHFSLTGYPSCKVEDWRRIFRIYRDHGLNTVRYHSCCPPEAAFQAADELGIVVQAEAGLWIDGWMGKFSPDRMDMYTKGEPKGVGRGDDDLDTFVQAEIGRILTAYGNSPSFGFFAIGNELGPSNFDVMAEWIAKAKAGDPRRLYMCSTARQVTKADDYMVTHNYPGVGWVRQRYENFNNWDFEDKYAKTKIPTIAHEIGQWPVYPDFNEIAKYTGTLKPLNLIEFCDQAKRKGTLAQNKELTVASGALNRIIYKDEIESYLRTPSCNGFQLLGMQDYSAQGEALIGWLDSFYDSKGTTDPATFRNYCAETVPLIRLTKYTWKTDETLAVDVVIHHYGREPLKGAVVRWAMASKTGELPPVDCAVGSVTVAGKISLPLDFVKAPTQCKLELSIAGTKFRNEWNLWVYPAALPALDTGDLVISEAWDEATKAALRAGKRVVLIAHKRGGGDAGNRAHWMPIYWSPSFLPTDQQVIGLILRNTHPALAQFPTATHSDWQWRPVCSGAHGFLLNDLPSDYRPIAQPVSHFHYSDRLGSIFELAVGKGSLLVCGYNITAARAGQELAVRQLRQSLLTYAAGTDFNPTQRVDESFLDTILATPKSVVDQPPGDVTGALLDVSCASKQSHGGDDVWSPEIDTARAGDGVIYKVRGDGTWKDGKGTYWHGKKIKATVQFPPGAKVSVAYVRLRDPETSGREGTVAIEGRSARVGPHPDPGFWVKLDVGSADLKDGRLVIETEASKGPNLMIDRLVVMP